MNRPLVTQLTPVNSSHRLVDGQSPILVLSCHLLLIASIVAVGIFTVHAQAPSVIAAFLIFGLFGALVTRKIEKSAIYLFGIVYCANVCIAIIVYSVYMTNYGTPYIYGGSDDLIFERLAQMAAKNLRPWEYSSIRYEITGPYYEPVGYVYILSLIYRIGESLGGFNTLLPRLMNGLALSLISVLVFVIAKRGEIPQRIARNTALIVGLLPIMTFTAAHTFRDVLISLMTIWVVYQWDRTLRWRSKRSNITAWAWTLLMALVMWEFRPTQAALLIILALVIDILLIKRRRSLEPLGGFFAVVIFSVFFGAIIWQGGFSWGLERASFYIDYYREYRLGISPGLSTYIFSAPMIISFPLRALYGLISPLPFVGQRFEELFQGAGTPLQYFFLPFLGLGMYLLIRRPDGRLWVWSFLLFYLVAMVTFTSRHIVIFFPYAALIAAYGYVAYSQHAKKLGFAILWTGLVLGAFYTFLRY